jgi:hypothetical protein
MLSCIIHFLTTAFATACVKAEIQHDSDVDEQRAERSGKRVKDDEDADINVNIIVIVIVIVIGDGSSSGSGI